MQVRFLIFFPDPLLNYGIIKCQFISGRQLVEEKNYFEVDEKVITEITKSAKNNRRDNLKNKTTPDKQINMDDYDIHPGYIGPPPEVT